jgi:hypothetical protein
MNCLCSLERWDRDFESYSRHGCLRVFILFVCAVLCAGSGLGTGWSSVQGVLPCKSSRNWKGNRDPTKGCIFFPINFSWRPIISATSYWASDAVNTDSNPHSLVLPCVYTGPSATLHHLKSTWAVAQANLCYISNKTRKQATLFYLDQKDQRTFRPLGIITLSLSCSSAYTVWPLWSASPQKSRPLSGASAHRKEDKTETRNKPTARVWALPHLHARNVKTAAKLRLREMWKWSSPIKGTIPKRRRSLKLYSYHGPPEYESVHHLSAVLPTSS